MNNRKILIIDDEEELRENVKEGLNKNGFSNVISVSNCSEARQFIKNYHPDLILLDIMLPNEDGLTFLKRLREESNIPVILLTAKGESEDIICGLQKGADDYITKPFLMKELILRIEAVLRRSYPESNIVYLKNSLVDLNKALVKKYNGELVNLTAKEFEIFKKLYINSGNIVSIDSLCMDIVGNIFTGYESTLMSHIRHLRQKIEKDPSKPESLITIRGLGYKLITEL